MSCYPPAASVAPLAADRRRPGPADASASTPPDLARRGVMLIVSSPSGAGKSTLTRALLAGDDQVSLSVSMTTRPPRPGEEEGVHYHFVSTEAFHDLIRNRALLEHAKVFDQHYGTPRAPVEAALAAGRDVLFDIDWQGCRQIVGQARADVVSVFILPPSLTELERRLITRGQDTAEVIARRMARARDEISHWSEYDYVLVNDDLERTIADLRAILRAERVRRVRRVGLSGFVNAL